MDFEIILLPGAETDLQAIIDWYSQINQVLPEYFLYELDVTIGKIKRNPFFSLSVLPGIRRATLKRFPFQVIYTEKESKVFIHAIMHQHWSPRSWQERLS